MGPSQTGFEIAIKVMVLLVTIRFNIYEYAISGVISPAP